MDRLTVDEVLAGLDARHPSAFELVAGSPTRAVHAVWLAEDLRDLGGCPAQALVVLTRAASEDAGSYKLDVALRRLGDAAGIVMQHNAPPPSLSGVAMARREDLPLIRLTRPIDTTVLLTSVIRILDGELPVRLDRTVAVCRAVDRLEAAGASDEDVLADSGAAQLFGFRLGRRDPQLDGLPAVLTDLEGRWLQRVPTGEPDDTLALLPMWRLTAMMTRRAIEADRAEQLSLMSAGEVVNQLLNAPADGNGPLLRRAARMGIRTDGWNQVITLEFTNLATLAGDDPVTAYHHAQTLARVIAQSTPHDADRWTVAPRTGGAVVLRTGPNPDTPSTLRRVSAALHTLLDGAVSSFPELKILCGVGGSHEGLHGLHASRAEADSALESARLRGAYNRPTMFDAPGLSRLLVEWYSSSSVRQSIEDLLAPLRTVGEAKQKEYVRTLQAYLENNRSVSRTAQALYVHRNTVAYRINKILDVLGVDLEDPSQFLAVYLACYAQSMHRSDTPAERGNRAGEGSEGG